MASAALHSPQGREDRMSDVDSVLPDASYMPESVREAPIASVAQREGFPHSNVDAAFSAVKEPAIDTHESTTCASGPVPDAAASSATQAIAAASWGDSPILALARQEWLSWHHRRLALAVRAHWPFSGDSKSLRACRADGLLPGLQGLQGRFLLAQIQSQSAPVDPLLPCIPGVAEKDLVKEVVAWGLGSDAAHAFALAVGQDMAHAASTCARIREELTVHATAAGQERLPAGGSLHLLRAPALSLDDCVVLLFQPDADTIRSYLAPVRTAAVIPPERLYGPVNMPLFMNATVSPARAALMAAGVPRGEYTAALQLNYGHFCKLALLYYMTANGGARPSPDAWRDIGMAEPRASTSWVPVRVPADFANAVFCMLARYEVFSGNVSGLQGAVPHHVFDALERACGLNVECFASPLNCHFPVYHSAFADTDAPFGSRGSFFAAEFAEGAFQANPPFVNATMLAMAKKMDILLQRAEERNAALLFFVIVPAWTDAYYHTLLTSSRYRRCGGTLTRKEHEYIDGLQHRVLRCTWGANVDSTWVVLATNAAVLKYGVTSTETAHAIVAAFHTRVHMVAATEEQRCFKFPMPSGPVDLT